MINPINKADCCGCQACAQRCPKQCITMQADQEGFLYPIVDKEACIDCGLCEKVCPVINQDEVRTPIKVLAAINKDEETRMQSSSGGVFTILAEETIKKGGVVFGVKFDNNWMPVFDYTETIEGIAPFRGSKYVQATVGNAYKDAERFLKAGREVLFSGTPCQIAGLNKYLRKEYNNLLTVDIVCHGVPSPKVWNMYLTETYSKLMRAMPDGKNSVDSAKGGESKSCIEAISFRSKISGWKKYSFLIKLNFSNYDGKNTGVFAETLDKNAYMRAFLRDIILRPSCYSCPAKQGKGHSDISIADFWGMEKIDNNLYDDKGTSAILINTEKGMAMSNIKNCITKQFTYEEFVQYNSAHIKSSKPHIKREEFFRNIPKEKRIIGYIDKYTKVGTLQRIVRKIRNIFKI